MSKNIYKRMADVFDFFHKVATEDCIYPIELDGTKFLVTTTNWIEKENKLKDDLLDKFITIYRQLLDLNEEVDKYINDVKKKSDLERTENKEKTGVELKGIKAINPVNNEEIPIFTADYVLAGYGTGAIMAVPAHDERDFEFAKKYNIKITQSIAPINKEHPDYETIAKAEL